MQIKPLSIAEQVERSMCWGYYDTNRTTYNHSPCHDYDAKQSFQDIRNWFKGNDPTMYGSDDEIAAIAKRMASARIRDADAKHNASLSGSIMFSL